MGDKFYLIGAGGHTRSLINILESAGLEIGGIYDDNFKDNEVINGYKLIGKLENIKIDDNLILSVGDNRKREKLFYKYYKQIYKERLIHPSAIIEKYVKIGESNQIFSGVYINSNVEIGNNNILNTKCLIEHEAFIGDHNHVSVGAILCGRAAVGNRCFIGAGATVIDKVRLCDDVVIGANSVVIEDIRESGIYAGNPVKKIR